MQAQISKVDGFFGVPGACSTGKFVLFYGSIVVTLRIMPESKRPRVFCLILAGLAPLGCLAAWVATSIARSQHSLDHSFSLWHHAGYCAVITLSILQFLIFFILIIWSFFRHPERPRVLWYSIALATTIIGLAFTLPTIVAAFTPTPDAIIDPAAFILIPVGIALGAWIIPTIILAVKIAGYAAIRPADMRRSRRRPR